MRIISTNKTTILLNAVWLFLVAVLFSGCYNSMKQTGAKINTTKTFYSYQKEAPKLNYKLKVYHSSNEKSKLYYQISTNSLAYNLNTDNSYNAFVKISYRLLNSSGNFLDSLTFTLNDKSNKTNNNSTLTGNVELNTTYGNTYFLEVKIKDLNQNTELVSLLSIDKSNGLTRENFLLKHKNNSISFSNYVGSTDTLLLEYNQKQNVKQLFVKYYNRDFQLPPPPFVLTNNKSFDYKPDSTFTLKLNAKNEAKFVFPKKGFYQIEVDSTSKTGYTIFRFNDDFPILSNGNDLLPPTRFITTRQEYEDMNLNNNKKEAIENFWIKNTGNKDKAKSALLAYYNRVEKANLYFTSYVDGWRTERGIVYLIFGAPNSIFKQSESETWLYGEEGNYRSTSFTFVKVLNPFTDNDYQLNRSEIYKEEWYRFVDAWRMGKIINE
ncbi:MAG: GWxTD domain-containing protein [Bacteroidota bacterium]